MTFAAATRISPEVLCSIGTTKSSAIYVFINCSTSCSNRQQTTMKVNFLASLVVIGCWLKLTQLTTRSMASIRAFSTLGMVECGNGLTMLASTIDEQDGGNWHILSKRFKHAARVRGFKSATCPKTTGTKASNTFGITTDTFSN